MKSQTNSGFSVKSHVKAGDLCVWYSANADNITEYFGNSDVTEAKFTILNASCEDMANAVDSLTSAFATTT